jgi:hypothetical protein
MRDNIFRVEIFAAASAELKGWMMIGWLRF